MSCTSAASSSDYSSRSSSSSSSSSSMICSNISPFQKIVTITRDVHLPPKFFDGNILHHLSSILIEQFSNKCDEELGVLIRLEKVRKMTNKISKNSMYADFTVTFDALVSKPIPNIEFEFVVEQVQPTGIFGFVDGMLKIYVPFSNLKEWVFEADETNAEMNAFISGEKIVRRGSKVKAQIKSIKYLVDKFGCISELL